MRNLNDHEDKYLHISREFIYLIIWTFCCIAFVALLIFGLQRLSNNSYNEGYKDGFSNGIANATDRIIHDLKNAPCDEDLTFTGYNETAYFKLKCPERTFIRGISDYLNPLFLSTK